MKVGVCVSQFRPSVEPALETARRAEACGLDGVFVFDHLWALNPPHRPAHSPWPLLGALAAETSRIVLGTLVTRVSLLPAAVLVHNFESLHRMLDGDGGSRLIAGLGAGDRQSRPENDAVGVPFLSMDERLGAVADAATRLRSLGITTWVGGLSAGVRQVAVASADALNLWGVEPERVAAEHGIEVTWGGVVPLSADAIGELLDRLAAAGATWAVCAPPYGSDDTDPAPAVEMVAEAAAALR